MTYNYTRTLNKIIAKHKKLCRIHNPKEGQIWISKHFSEYFFPSTNPKTMKSDLSAIISQHSTMYECEKTTLISGSWHNNLSFLYGGKMESEKRFLAYFQTSSFGILVYLLFPRKKNQLNLYLIYNTTQKCLSITELKICMQLFKKVSFSTFHLLLFRFSICALVYTYLFASM